MFIPILQASSVLDSSTGAATEVSLLQISTKAKQLASANVPTFDFAKDLLLIYQYGKVASTSLQDGLGSLMIPKTQGITYINGPQESYPRGAKIHRQDTATDFLSHVHNGSDVWVITATRSRFSRDISTFFQCLAAPQDDSSTECFNCMHHSPFVGLEEEEIKHVTLGMNVSALHDVFRKWWHGPDYKDDWFSRDFYDAIGVNMLHHVDEIVKTHKTHIWWQQKSKDNRFNLNVILLRFEDVARWSQILSQYFPGFKMPAANQGSDRWYSNIYQEFLKSYQFSKHEIDAICQGDTMKFYSAEERPEMCNPSIVVPETSESQVYQNSVSGTS
jgi:hypothetical protein